MSNFYQCIGNLLNHKLKLHFSCLAVMISLTGCAISPGLQTYDLPEQGNYTTPQGANLDVVQLTRDTIPQIAFNANPRGQFADVRQLFNSRHSEYRLSPNDVLAIQLWAYPEITPPATDATSTKAAGFPIDTQGNIYLPVIGKVRAAGKTVPELSQTLRSQFAKYLKTPDVLVRVLSYEGKRYFVNGQVMKSGEYTLSDQPVSVYTALGMAGGINTQSGDNSAIQLIRDGRTYDLNALTLEKYGYSLHKLLIKPNDTIFVNNRQNQKIYVMGESNKTQSIVLREQGMSLADTLGESEGVNPYTASAARIYVMRNDNNNNHATIYQLNLSDLGNLALAQQFAMQKNDIVYVDATGLTRWQRVLSQIIPFSSAIYGFKQIGNN